MSKGILQTEVYPLQGINIGSPRCNLVLVKKIGREFNTVGPKIE